MWNMIIPALMAYAASRNSGGGQEMTGRTETSMPEWQENLLHRVSKESEGLATQPYQTYGGPRLAQFNPMQRQSFDLASRVAGAAPVDYGQNYSNATKTLSNAGGMFDEAAAERYMKPYRQLVIDRSMSEIDRQAGFQDRDIQDRMVKTGNFGGARHGVADAERMRNTLDVKANTIANMNDQNYMQAAQQFNADRAGQMGIAQGQAGLAGQGQGMALKGIGAVGAAGALDQAQTQSNLDLAYNDFQNQQTHPKSQMDWLSNITRGIPQTGQNTTTYAPKPSGIQQVAGLGLGLYGMMANAPQGSAANNWMTSWFGK